ncbi:MAG: hypothetical protein EBS01_10355 [Verrucomicrobia bacterium]|nr:hypothetical protein [Verrucomicrobiota bacterium]
MVRATAAGCRWKTFLLFCSFQWRNEAPRVAFRMEQPPFDPLAEYLEAHEILSSLHTERTRLLQFGAELERSREPSEAVEQQGVELAVLLARLSAGIDETVSLIVTYEEYLEERLGFLADYADAGRALFASVTAQIEELQTRLLDAADDDAGYDASPASADAPEGGERPRSNQFWEWEVILRDYERIRAFWMKSLPIGDLPGSD